MRMTVVAAAAALALSVAAPALAQSESNKEGFYLRLDTGWSFSRNAGDDFDNDLQNSPIIGGGVGYRLNDYLRGDFTLTYRGGFQAKESGTLAAGFNGSAEADVSAVTGMINIYADAPKLFDRVTPYVGGGVGVSRNHVGETDAVFAGVPATVDSGTNTSFAWQVSAGFAVDLAPDWLLELGYRYVDLGKIETGDNFTIAGATVPGARSTGNLSAHEIQLGIRYQF